MDETDHNHGFRDTRCIRFLPESTGPEVDCSSTKLFAKMKDECNNRAKLDKTTHARVSEVKFDFKPEQVLEDLLYMRMKQRVPDAKLKVSAAKWDELFEQIRNVASMVNSPVAHFDWSILLGKIGHAELRTWIDVWRREIAMKLGLARQKLETARQKERLVAYIKNYELVVATLKFAEQNYSKNIKIVITALDQSAVNTSTAYLALNVLIKQAKLWLPVFND